MHHSSHPLSLLFALSFLLLFSACGNELNPLDDVEGCSQELQTCNAHVFLSVEQFEFLRQQGAHILDTRSPEEFSQGHIPGSFNANWQAFADTEHRNGIVWEDTDLLQDAARSFGINSEDTVIVLGAGDGSGGDARAGRLFWTLEYLGHNNVYLVDGGYQAWLDARYDNLEAGLPTPPTGNFEVTLRPELRATLDEVEAAINDGSIRLVDTRTVEEWIGENLRNNPRGGHIPEAIHFYWEDALQDGFLRPKDELRSELEALGILPGTLTIPYCQSGVRSGYFYAILKWLDYPNPKNYDGSWWEWSRSDNDIVVPEN